MEFLILILIFGGFWFVSWIFSAISNAIEASRSKTREQVANEVLAGVDIEKSIEKFQKKLNYIGHKREDIFSKYSYYQTHDATPPTKILGNCPECKNGFLQLRKGPYGKFLGCSNYPDCRHTEVDRGMKKYKQKAGEHFWDDIEKAYS